MKTTILTLSSVMVLGLLYSPAWAQPQPPQPIPMGPAAGSPLFATQPPPSFPTQPPPSYSMQPFAPPPPVLSQPFPPYQTPMAPPPSPLSDPFLGVDHGGWTVDIGAYFIQPVFQSNAAFINSHISNSGAAVFHQTNFDETFTVAPLTSISYTFGNGWGIRGRWFEFSSGGDASGIVGSNGVYLPGLLGLSAASGSAISASSVLYGDVIDLELTHTWGGERWWLTASAGLRYVHLNQSYALEASNVSVYAVNNFDGGGPTVSLEGHHQLGWSHFGLYGSVRGSIAVGEGHQWGTDNDPGYGPVAGGGHELSVLCIGEMEMGVEWSRRIGRFQPFMQLGGVGQIWGGAGTASQAASVYTTGTTASNLGFIGAAFKAGINF